MSISRLFTYLIPVVLLHRFWGSGSKRDVEIKTLQGHIYKDQKNLKRDPQLQGFPCRLGFPPTLSLLLGLFFGRHHQREERLAAREGVQLGRPPTAPSPRRLVGDSIFQLRPRISALSAVLVDPLHSSQLPSLTRTSIPICQI